jgi:formiminotetrahydrofolate cyclodeaminase
MLRLEDFLGALSSGDPTPSAGSAAAVVAALAAGLCAMAARLSPGLAARSGLMITESEQLRDAAVVLAQADAEAYGRLLTERRSPVEQDAQGRTARIADALAQATAVPVELCRTSARIAQLAAELAADGNPNVRGESIAAAVLAAATADAAGALVTLNAASAHHGAPLLDNARDDATRALRSARSDADRARARLPHALSRNDYA